MNGRGRCAVALIGALPYSTYW